MKQLKAALKTSADSTVFRVLNQVNYTRSYSHRGKFYTLNTIPCFNENGLWSYRNIHFSRNGSLLDAIKSLIVSSNSGYDANELENILCVNVRLALITLLERQQFKREKINGRYIYFDIANAKAQASNRKNFEEFNNSTLLGFGQEFDLEEGKGLLRLFLSILDEKQKRLYAGFESLKIGNGGDARISELFEMDPHTVAKGRKELLAKNLNEGIIRKRGGGRKALEKKHLK